MSTINDDQLVERLVPKILAAIRARSMPVESMVVKSDLAGITSVPCYDTSDGKFQKVLLAMDTLEEVALNASKNAVLENESERIANEDTRIKNENVRQQNEIERTEQFSIWTAHGVNHPKIGDNGNWFFWSEADGQYIDSGVLAVGGIFLPYLYVDDNMQLCMSSDSADLGRFEYDDKTGYILFIRNINSGG